MKAFIPRNLSSQLALVMAGALLIASLVNFVLLLGERQRAVMIEQSGAPMARFVDIADGVFASPPAESGRLTNIGRGPGRYSVQPDSLIDEQGLERHEGLEQRLSRALADAGVTPSAVRACTRTIAWADRISERVPGFSRDRDGPPDGRPQRPTRDHDREQPPDQETREIVLSAQLPDGRWLTSVAATPEAPHGDLFLLGASTFVTFIFVLAAAVWVASRLSRPLRDLAAAAGRVGDAQEPQQVEPRGPGDVQQTIAAFNAMSHRVSQLLREKDVMLGALGHDLRTPLASLRIRVETMEPEAERLKAVRTIEEATELLEDILELSRQGKSREPERTIDVSVIVEDMVEDYVETGAPVNLVSTQRSVTACRPVLLRRALRNLIDNAVTYGGAARLTVESGGGHINIHVDDDGPGMSPEALGLATDPFYRGETSRNSSTGGAGLGLTLSEAIARAHGGGIILANRSPHGLRATIRLPVTQAGAA